MKKRILSVLLAFAMIFTLMPTALAAPTTYQVVTVDKTTVQAGETVNVKVTLPKGIRTAGSFTVVMNFDKEKFEVMSLNYPDDLEAWNEAKNKTASVEVVTNTPDIANVSGELTANATYAYNTMKVAGVTVIDATLKAKASGVAAFSFSIFEITYSDNGPQYIVKKDQLETPPSVTIPKAPITSVTAKVDAPQKGVALDTTVDVGGATAYTGAVKWYVGETEATETIAKANTKYTAKITLTAGSGESFDAALDNTTTTEGYAVKKVSNTELLLTKTFDATGNKTLNGIDIITNPALTLAVPTAAPNDTATNERSLAVTGVYDDGSGGPVAVSWKITTNPIPKGVSLVGSTLKVTNEAEAGQVRVLATSAEGYTDAEIVTITKEPPAASAIVATAPTTTSITIPNVGTTTSGNCSYKVYDQYGAEMTGISATWKMEPETVTGVTLTSTGGIAVNNTATTGTVNLYATSGALESNKITFNIAREASVATSLTIEGTPDSVTVPTVTEPGTTSCAYAAYTAKVLDQYGAEMTGETIAWSDIDNPGVTFNNGQLTVTNKANAGTVTITATSGTLSATKTVTINKATAKETFVKITAQDNEPPVTTIICTGSQRLESYTATVYDQYGEEKQDNVTWSLDPTSYSGVTYEISETNNNIVTLKVAPNAEVGTFKLVATSQTVTTAKHELEITVQKKTDVSGKINFNAGSLTYNGEGQKYEKAALDSSVTAGTGGHWAYTYTVKSGSTGTLDAANLPKTAGTYTVTTTYEDSTNVGTATATLTIVPKVLHSSDLEKSGGSASKVYDGTATSSITVRVKTSSLCGTDTLPINGSAVYNSADVADANQITFTPAPITAGNYTLAATEKLTIHDAKITPKDLTVTPNAGQSKKFGAVDPTLHSTNSGRVPGQIPDFTGALSRAEGENVGQYDITLGTLALMDHFSSGFKASNYTLKLNSTPVKFEITKADAPTLTNITVSQKYTVTTGEKAIGTVMPADAGTLTYAKGTESKTGSVTIDSWAVDTTGKVTFTLSGGAAGDTVTLPVIIGSTNYANATVNVVITLTAKDDQAALTLTGGTTVVYGQTLQLGTSGGSGTGTVTYAVTNGTGEATIDATGKLTPVKVGTVKVKATKAEDANYNAITSAEVEITITRATPTGAPKYTAITTRGKTLADAGLTTAGSTLNPNAGTLVWVDNAGNVLPPDTTAVAANTTYKWLFTPTDANYTTLTGSIELYHKSSSGGGGRSYTYYTIKATAGTNGSISPSGWASVRLGRDQTFTITPDKGYTVAKVLVDGKSVGAVKSYTFKNVTKDHTIEAIFMKSNGNPQTGVFVDVAEGSYYEEAIDWAVEKGITNGVSSNMFAPNDPCTRGQIVTFLWRAMAE